jgi:hypothetical protein
MLGKMRERASAKAGRVLARVLAACGGTHADFFLSSSTPPISGVAAVVKILVPVADEWDAPSLPTRQATSEQTLRNAVDGQRRDSIVSL